MKRIEKIINLDRNVVDLMRMDNEGKNITTEKQLGLLQFLKDNDVLGVIFSPFFSLIEGKISKKNKDDGSVELIKSTHRSIRELIHKECDIINKFVKNARTDSDFLLKREKLIAKNIYESEHDTNLSSKLKLLDELKLNLFEIVKAEKKWDEYIKFKSILSRHPQFKEHPFVLVVLMYIFGSSKASAVLKFKRKDFIAYNPIADFNHIKLFNRLKGDDRINKSGCAIVFLSLDSDIDFINNLIITDKVTLSSISNYTSQQKTIIRFNKRIIIDEIIKTNNKVAIGLFYKCFEDFYGYDLRTIND